MDTDGTVFDRRIVYLHRDYTRRGSDRIDKSR